MDKIFTNMFGGSPDPFKNGISHIIIFSISLGIIISNIFLYIITEKKIRIIKDPEVNKTCNYISLSIYYSIKALAWSSSIKLITHMLFILCFILKIGDDSFNWVLCFILGYMAEFDWTIQWYFYY